MKHTGTKRLLAMVLALILALSLTGPAFATGDTPAAEDTTVSEPTPTATATAENTATPAPTATAEPTATPAPTATAETTGEGTTLSAEPSSEPQPSPEQSPEPTPETPATYASVDDTEVVAFLAAVTALDNKYNELLAQFEEQEFTDAEYVQAMTDLGGLVAAAQTAQEALSTEQAQLAEVAAAIEKLDTYAGFVGEGPAVEKYVADVAGSWHETLESAVESALLLGEPITLLKDVTVDQLFALSSGQSLTINGEGYTLTFVGDDGYIDLTAASLTVNNAKLVFNESYGYGINMKNGSKLNMEGSTVTITGRHGGIRVSQGEGVTSSITGGSFEITGCEEMGGFNLTGGSLDLSGCSFDIHDNTTEYDGGGISVDGAVLTFGQGATAKIYNNSVTGTNGQGDDIYVFSGTINGLPAAPTDMTLTGCGEAIDGWYYDGGNGLGDETPWSCPNGDENAYAEAFEGDAVSCGEMAVGLKAAHSRTVTGVAMIIQDDGTEKIYPTLDDAVEAAIESKEATTIYLLADCDLSPLWGTLTAPITFDGGENKFTIDTDVAAGLHSWSQDVTFRNCVLNVFASAETNTNYGAINLGSGAKLTFDNAEAYFDGTNFTGNANGIYFWKDTTAMDVKGGSILSIKNFPLNAMLWEKGNGYRLNITDSTYISENNRSGFTGTFNVVIDNSKVSVTKSTGNASNGSNFEIRNKSVVDFSGNKDHGLSAGTLLIDDSTVTANNNGANGIHTNNTLTIQNGAVVTIEGNDCEISSLWTIPGALHVGAGQSVIEGSTVTIQNNSGSGIYQKAADGSLTIKDDANVTVVKNTAVKLGLGGGIYVNGTVDLGSGVVLYNNHAGTAGDDIYVVEGGSITFPATGADWALDGEPDCTDAIDGWYYDGYYMADGEAEAVTSRWEAHNVLSQFIEQYGSTSGTGLLALKAAHGIITIEDQPGPVAPVWDTSKSKTATNLDANFESQVTLSLPSATYNGTLDVVFVLDGSTSADQSGLAAQAAAMVGELAAMENLDVSAGLVVFGGSTPILENTGLLDISDATNLNTLTTKLTDPSYNKMDGRSGSNLQAGVQVGKELLATGTAASADKYLIILSDGGARMWYENGQSIHQAYGYGDGADKPAQWNSNEDFNYRYGASGVTGQFDKLRTFQEVWNAGQSGIDIGAYGMTQAQTAAAKVGDPGVASWSTAIKDPYYYTTFEAATYYAALEIGSAMTQSNVIFVAYPYHSGLYEEYASSFRGWLGEHGVALYDAGSANVFSNVKDQLIHLVDEGTTVVDYMGYVEGDYNFDFINDVEHLTLTVGGVEKPAVKLMDNVYGFGEQLDGFTYEYNLTYYPADDGQESFKWTVNVPVTKDAPVKLTYTVKLMDPKTDPGQYGQYDGDGSKGYEELYTNNSATLKPVDSNGTPGSFEEFPKPTVSYTVGGSSLPSPEDPALDVSRSKYAQQLEMGENGKYYSDVTLSLPSAKEQLVTDVVFVLDKSTSPALEEQALKMLTELKSHVDGTQAKVKVGVVIFNKVANTTGELYDLATEYDTIEAQIKQEISSGTNTHAGLLAGVNMLANDTSVDDGRKFLIFVSDGITYMYGEEPTATAWSFNQPNSEDDWYGPGSFGTFAGPDNWYSKYHNNNAPANWNTWLAGIETMVNAQGTTYEYPYGGTVVQATPQDINNWDKGYAMSIDKALYLTYKVYYEASQNYNCYSVVANTGSGGQYTWGPDFMTFLANGKNLDFSQIQNDILFLVDNGSTVVDYMGYVEATDGVMGYNFDFVNSADALNLTVNGVTYDTVQATSDRNVYYFNHPDTGETEFALEYTPGDKMNGEYFTWKIYVPIMISGQVQLTYRVELQDPQTAPGIYGTYDGYGEGIGTALYTNNSATLYPVDSNGQPGTPKEFPKPTVSYEVEGTTPTPTPTPGTDPTPTPTPTDPPAVPPLVDIEVDKKWSDWGNVSGTRPGSITVYLYANGEYTGRSLTLTAANGWRGTFEDVQSCDQITGVPIDFTVYELQVSGYNGKILRNSDYSFTIINSYYTIPFTGDDSNIALWAALAGVCLVAVGGIAVVLKRRSKKAKD